MRWENIYHQLPSVCTIVTGVLCDVDGTWEGVVSPVEMLLGEPDENDSSLGRIAMTTGLSGLVDEADEGLVLSTPPPY